MTGVLFRTPTWERLRYIQANWRHQSILRCLEYERMERLSLIGRVLDFGGGQKSNYSSRLSEWGTSVGYRYESANIDASTAPTHLIHESGAIPVPDDYYDAVISLNTFEHIYSTSVVLAEIGRVLKPRQTLTFIVPFIFRVHGHPNDYHRGTASYWDLLLREHGFSDVTIEALLWGPFTTASTVSGLPGPLKGARPTWALYLDLVYSKLTRRERDDEVGQQDEPPLNVPLAYFIQASNAG